ncbi:hypothetical protein P691DRAFT_808614 [Macrolepiota fuliginosa MF-IS2]|uniref:DUF6533 domain-containing protein n=1 Tax=Macrolepiota fuliginosa MF-IS2 TaxID=1400762 RepID=A0A9P5XSA4_9AGAR|nr:hypothetical protein P691DRAFT_808614 [Macrolepiota fuliginosa MF-IS2]
MNLNEVQIRQYWNVAGLAVLVYDQILTWEQEVQYIWLSSEVFIKFSYFLSRYLALTIQIVGVIHSSFPVLQKRRGNCIPWLAFQTFGAELLLWNLELGMMIRVYALYDRARLMGTLLTLWFTFSGIFNFWNGISAMTDIETDLFCIIAETPNSSKWFSLTIAVNQCLLWALTFHKYRSAVKEGWARHPIIRVVIRDNSWVFLTFSGLLAFLLPYSLYIHQVGGFVYPLFTCVTSIVSCRLVLNIRSIKNINNNRAGQVELTTILAMSEEEYSLSEMRSE